MKNYILAAIILIAGVAHAQNPTQADTNRLTRTVSGKLGIDTNGASVGQVPTRTAGGIIWSTPVSGAPTGTVSDARYVIKSGFGSGAQALDGSLNLNSGNDGVVFGMTNMFKSNTPRISFLTSGGNGWNIWVDASNLSFLSPIGTFYIGNVANSGILRANDWDFQASAGSVFSTGPLTASKNFTSPLTNILSGLRYPTSDGTANQVIKTDGAGILSFATVSAAGGDIFSASNNFFSARNVFGTNANINSGSPIYIQNPAAPSQVNPSALYIVTDTTTTAGMGGLQIGPLSGTNSAFQGSSAFSMNYLGDVSYLLTPLNARLGIKNGSSYTIMVGWPSLGNLDLNHEHVGGITTMGRAAGSSGALNIYHGTTRIGVSGVAFSNLTTVTASIDAPSIAAATEWSTNITLAAATVGGAYPMRIFTKTAMIDYSAFCTNAGEVTIELYNRNPTIVAVDPANQTIGVSAINY